VVRSKVALTAILAAALAVVLIPVACRQIPGGTLNNAGNDATVDTIALARDAEAAFSQTPRTIERVRTSAKLFAHALRHEEARSYETLWQAARTSAWLAEFETDAVERERHAREGLTYANTALKAQADGAEALFYHGVLAGFLGDLDNDFGLDAVKEIEKDMNALIEKDRDVSNGGPWRVLGVLQLRAPGPPVSVGSLRNAKKNLETALEKSPDWPENHLYMAEAEFMWAKDKEKPEFAEQARKRLHERLLGESAKAPPGFEFEFAAWQDKARALLDAQK
jgi:hypothetical protein